MDKIFKARGFFTVPDGTDVSAFLNATDTSQSDVPWGSLGELSIAAGRIAPGLRSAVHVHPVIMQVTYLVAGTLTVRMRGPGDTVFYDLEMIQGDAVVTRPSTFFQLRNDSEPSAEVLYITSPSYVFEMNEDGIVYDDAVVVSEDWEDGPDYDQWSLKASLDDVADRRRQSLARIAQSKGVSS